MKGVKLDDYTAIEIMLTAFLFTIIIAVNILMFMQNIISGILTLMFTIGFSIWGLKQIKL